MKWQNKVIQWNCFELLKIAKVFNVKWCCMCYKTAGGLWSSSMFVIESHLYYNVVSYKKILFETKMLLFVFDIGWLY